MPSAPSGLLLLVLPPLALEPWYWLMLVGGTVQELDWVRSGQKILLAPVLVLLR